MHDYLHFQHSHGVPARHAGRTWNGFLDSGLFQVVGFKWGTGVVSTRLRPPFRRWPSVLLKDIPIAVLSASPA